MYNDYYLQSIDSKLNNLQNIISNQETIISNQQTIITNQQDIKDVFAFTILWVLVLIFATLFYYFFHNCFNRYK